MDFHCDFDRCIAVDCIGSSPREILFAASALPSRHRISLHDFSTGFLRWSGLVHPGWGFLFQKEEWVRQVSGWKNP
jgi:hypothetical protein